MKMTLLDMTQSILSSLGSDQVNSISDTVESLQVAECLRTTYYNMLGRYDLPEHNDLIQLISSTDPAKPTLMTMPPNLSRIEWVKYFDTNPAEGQQVDQFGAFSHDLNVNLTDSAPAWFTTSSSSNSLATGAKTFTVASGLDITAGDDAFCFTGEPPTAANSMSGTVTSYSGTTLVLNITTVNGAGTYTNWTISQDSLSIFGPGYLYVQVLPIEHFMDMISRFDPGEDDVGSYQLPVTAGTDTVGDFTIYYKNSHQPWYCCILSNEFVIFDSYDSTQDSALQGSKTMAMAWAVPQWSMTDSFTPDIDIQHFPLLLNDAKSLAFAELKQMPHQKAEKEVARQEASLQKWKSISGKPTYFDELPSFGRLGSFGGIRRW